MKFCPKTIKKKGNTQPFFTPRVVKHWQRLPREAVVSIPSGYSQPTRHCLSSRARLGNLKRSLPTKRSLSFCVTKSKKINNNGEAHGNRYTEFISVIWYSELQVLSGSCRQTIQLYYTGSHVSHLSSHTDFIVFLEVEELKAETERQQLQIWTLGWFKAENTTERTGSAK